MLDKANPSSAPEKFFNILQKRLFYEVDKQVDQSRTRKTDINHKDYSLKLTVYESDVDEYFQNRYLNLGYFLKEDQTDSTSSHKNRKQFITKRQFDLPYRYFFVTFRHCRAIYLNNEITQSHEQLLALYNSNLYDKLTTSTNLKLTDECYYFDKSTRTFYLTVSTFF